MDLPFHFPPISAYKSHNITSSRQAELSLASPFLNSLSKTGVPQAPWRSWWSLSLERVTHTTAPATQEASLENTTEKD